MWFGTGHRFNEGVGVVRYDGDKFTTYTAEDGLGSNTIHSIFQDRKGNLWFGTVEGVSRFDGQTWKTFTTDDGLPHNWVNSIVEDQEGNLWFGTGEHWRGGGGISRYDGKQFRNFTIRDGLPQNGVLAMLMDRENHLWVCTWNQGRGGLSRFDGKQFRTFTVEDGLVYNAGLHMLEDRKGHLWFCTYGGGISRYDGLVFQKLSRQDGLAGNLIDALLQDRNGDIWISTERGVTRYRPSYTPPPAKITNVVADYEYGPVEQLSLSTSQHFVSFEFLGQSFKTLPDQMVYVYQLEGYDEDWHQTRENIVSYTDLPIGNYTFEVKAVDRDLNYSEEPATVRVIVHPPYGQIALWSGLGVSLIGLILASGYGIKRNRERNRAREQLVQDLEEELQTAHDMQMGLMPTESPKIQGFDIAGRCLPANHVGGDFFQYFPISDNRLAISLADVTGHAMEAAVPVMMFSGILDTQMEAGDSLENLFARLNRSLHRNLDKRTFVCFAMGELDTDTRKFRLSNGGCPYPYHYKAASGEIVELQVDGYPLGVRAESTYPVIEAQLDPGDRIVFCSDGIIEAENSEEEMFGFERTAETIRKGSKQNLSAPQLLDHLINEVKQFTGETPQGDDQTIVVLRVEA